MRQPLLTPGNCAVLLGEETDTLDPTGDVIKTAEVPALTVEDVHAALAPMRGSVMQQPPAFSALKVKGERAYDLARRGEAVELEPRPVELRSAEVLEVDGGRLRLRLRTGAGYYVRSLARDLATALGTVGRLEALRRTESGKFRIEEAVSVEELRAAHRGEGQAPPLIPVADALRTLPELTLSRQEYREIAGRGSVPRSLMGRQLPELAGGEELTNGDEELEVKLLAPNGALAAIGGARNGRIERVVTFFR